MTSTRPVQVSSMSRDVSMPRGVSAPASYIYNFSCARSLPGHYLAHKITSGIYGTATVQGAFTEHSFRLPAVASQLQ